MVAVSTMTSSNATDQGEPILSRVDRIDVMLRQLEEIKGSNNNNPMHTSSHSAKSSCESTPSSGGSTLTTSEYYASSTVENLSTRSLQEKHCRPIQSVMVETGAKGTLIERLDHVEERVLKMCTRLEEELETHAAGRKRVDGDIDVVKVKVDIDDDDEATRVSSSAPREKVKKKRGFKELVKQCVTGKTT